MHRAAGSAQGHGEQGATPQYLGFALHVFNECCYSPSATSSSG